MIRIQKRNAFTLIELLVVVAIIALLLSILLPALGTAREQGKKAKCLANLNNLGKSLYAYANEDRAEQAIPISETMLPADPEPIPFWLHRTANWFTWGGRSGQDYFYTGPTQRYFLSEDEDQFNALGGAGLMLETYAARRRPLNIYMLGDVGIGDAKQMEWFRCPSDRGYPDNPYIDDCPSASFEKVLYDILGNSYRGSLASWSDITGAGASPAQSWFALGPWGHRLTTIVETGRTVLAGEPTWFNMIGQDQGGSAEEVQVYGWHKRKMMDNLLFCDGSARTTKAEAETIVDAQTAQDMNVAMVGGGSTLARYGSVKLDVYPTPGAKIGDFNLGGFPTDKWPFLNYQDNLRGN